MHKPKLTESILNHSTAVCLAIYTLGNIIYFLLLCSLFSYKAILYKLKVQFRQGT